MKEGKNLKLGIGRADLIGDCIMALPMLHYFEKRFPNSYKIWPILRKCSQAAPLFFNNPWIDRIEISDLDEGFGEKDETVFNSCDIKINVRPEHKYIDWHNKYSMCLETWLMGGLPEQAYNNLTDEEKTPTLYKWFNTNKLEKTIAVHCFAGYGRDNQRSPTVQWWEKTFIDLIKSGYKIIRLGHPNEPLIYFPQFHHFILDSSISECQDLRHLSFIDQIRIGLGCSCYIGTDSGFSLAMGAYSHPQCSLITNWNRGHTENFLCLQPLNRNNISLFNEFDKGGCSGIQHEKVLESIKLLVN